MILNLKLKNNLADLAYTGDIKPAFHFIDFILKSQTRFRDYLDNELTQKTAVAQNQLNQSANDDYACKMLALPPYGSVKLKKLIIVFHGWELIYCEEYLNNE